jgi:uncharacterized membrane protein YphA (DoxX/SURF4 family)
MVNFANSAATSRSRTLAYWASTAIVAAEFLVGGVMDLMHMPPFFGVMLHLGYPPYFSVIIGTWKVLGAAAVLVPRSARLKEWAYAGMVFDLTGAAASHLAVGNGAGAVVVPLVFTGLVMVSWALRPPVDATSAQGIPSYFREPLRQRGK